MAFANTDISPVSYAQAITLSDSTVNRVSRLFYVGTGGDLKVRFVNSSTPVTLVNHPSGYVSGQVDMFYSTGTTASNIVSFY